ncbi:glutamine--tRNA ligase/YqeY domain fusion protein [Kiritimatiella glycovorans]|uniref:Glutamine--tRNA ligase n=1 Tax=Kiritimatiella glycovorans TaxID=1307763 RepID=A0A0G3ED34_9BACT|nr:glutamine--tRNA ligase/YqeY domain fusion protein [Kiritimatiella glycovorans]AKJ64228.1 Glutamine--tRNA ligase [Kiritimatiella glycovorans]
MSEAHTPSEETPNPFIWDEIDADRAAGRYGGAVVTRFPPEPNGYLHIGHAKSICLNFGTAERYGGRCHLRFDDTNPEAEDPEYVNSIREDVRWLGFDWGEHLYFASDYFERMYACACLLIRKGLAYVCELNPEEFKAIRGTPTRPGGESPGRERSPGDNLALFEKMRAGEFENGAYVLRARIDMSSPNMHLRDPALYRIRHVSHHRTGDAWCVYPTYDFAHGLEDAFEGVTHSICTQEFEVHRPLYEWLLQALEFENPPRQIEFARLNLSYTIMSKRRLLELVREGLVDGWDDPRLPTLCGLRRRGFTPESIQTFCRKIGVTKFEGVSDIALLEHCVRDHLNAVASRRLAVLDPVRLVIENYPEDAEETFEAVNNPEDKGAGTRPIPFARELWVERGDYMEDPPRKFRRLSPGTEVRLRYACLFTCSGAVYDEEGRLKEIRGTFDPESRGGSAPDGRKVRGTIHWVSARHGVDAEVRLYDRLFNVPDPAADDDFKTHLNPDSLQTVRAVVEPEGAGAEPGTHIQFERLGYFCVDRDSTPESPVFNRTVPLRDTWGKKGKG